MPSRGTGAALHTEKAVSPGGALAASFFTPVPALIFPMPFAGLRQACRFVFAAERHQRPFLSH